MAAKEDLIFRNLIVRLGLATSKQTEECLNLQKSRFKDKSLSLIMIEQGYITSDQGQIVESIQKRNVETQAVRYRQIKEDYIFGRLAVKLSLTTEARVDECLGMQTMQGDSLLRLSERMLKKSYLTEAEIQQTLDYQASQVIRCPNCDTEYNVALFRPEAKFLCYKCEQELSAPPLPKSLA